MIREHRLTGKPLIFFLANATISAIVICYVITKVNLNELLAYLINANFSWGYVVIMLFLIQIILAVYRWSRLLQLTDISINYRQSLTIWLEGSFFNQALPSVIGGDIIRIWRISTYTSFRKSGFQSIALDRLYALIAIIVMASISFPLISFSINTNIPHWQSYLPVLGICVTSILILNHRHIPISPQLRNIRILKKFELQSWRALTNKTLSLEFLAISILVHGFTVTQIFIIAKALHIDISIHQCFILIPPILLVQTLPISLNGWGVREGAMITALSWISLTASQAVAVSVVYGLLVLLISLIGGVVRLYPNMLPKYTKGDVEQTL